MKKIISFYSSLSKLEQECDPRVAQKEYYESFEEILGYLDPINVLDHLLSKQKLFPAIYFYVLALNKNINNPCNLNALHSLDYLGIVPYYLNNSGFDHSLTKNLYSTYSKIPPENLLNLDGLKLIFDSTSNPINTHSKYIDLCTDFLTLILFSHLYANITALPTNPLEELPEFSESLEFFKKKMSYQGLLILASSSIYSNKIQFVFNSCSLSLSLSLFSSFLLFIKKS